jgi:hypothetical protein
MLTVFFSKKHKRKSNLKRGITLIELVVVISASAVVLLAIFPFFDVLTKYRIKGQIIGEVDRGGHQISSIILQSIRDSNGITEPISGGKGSRLSLSKLNSAKNPTVFDFRDNGIFMREGGGQEVKLNSERVNINSFVFENRTQADSSGLLSMVFNLSYPNPAEKPEFNYSRSFYTSGALRLGEGGGVGVSCGLEADSLVVDISQASLSDDGRTVSGIRVSNSNSNCSILIDKIETSWMISGLSLRQIIGILSNSTLVWSESGPGSPGGSQPSGILIDIVDVPVSSTDSFKEFKLYFDINMTGATLDINFIMIDGSNQITQSSIVL